MVEQVANSDGSLGSTYELTRTVAVNLHKLTAYKDEYEVARLMLLDEGLAEARRLAGASGSISYRLHPPMLRALGMKEKLSIPVKGAPALAVLAKGKRLRGTKLDPFRFPEVRRIERELPGEYRTTIDELVAGVDETTYDLATEIAGLPDHVRGYEELKVRRAATYRSRTAALMRRFRELTTRPTSTT
ncbi:MAG: DUF6537 domain-containing protein [Acidimicrobiales bacterium]